ncbi:MULTISPECIES: hypothetical protein [Chelatococcus]|uniref:Uncharacterized protein n=1 Tax=Chelatococcus caeni TaxID=1348468 RepID=A0A840BTA1_9HYPH|nr:MULTISPECIES: hypothetical protein [Chelatococcus]ALA18661.1 hypothetical protein AL346_16170 [Chelatococcus sp. CO-6]MBB4015813.1 hypothetical protein [Chelatococcus caeni]
MDQGVFAAVRRFPDRRQSIEELALRDEGFRSICADLAEAERALRLWESSTSANKEERCTEYRTLVACLVDELRAAIDAASNGPAL